MIQLLKLFSLTIAILVVTAFNAFSGAKIITVGLDWLPPQTSSVTENTFRPSLYFSGAVYSDSMPRVPIHVQRVSAGIPQYETTFALSNEVVIACTKEETEILQEDGFNASVFYFTTDQEIAAGETYSRFHLVPVRKTAQGFEKLLSFDISVTMSFQPELKQARVVSYPESSVLAQGQWFRICVENEGVYRLDKQDLVNLGIAPEQLDKSTIRLYGNGAGMLPEANNIIHTTDLKEHAIWVSGDNSGFFGNDDYVLFYGQSPNRWSYNSTSKLFEHQVHLYSKENCYFLSVGQGPGKRIATLSNGQQTPTQTVNEFFDYSHYEKDLVNLIGSGKIWYGELFDVTLSRTFDFTFPNITSAPVQVNVSAAARSSSSSQFVIEGAGEVQEFSIGAVSVVNATGVYAGSSSGKLSLVPQGDNIPVKITYKKTSNGGKGWLNYITLNARRRLIMTGDQMFFRNPLVSGNGKITRFEMGGMSGSHILWDVTDPFNVGQQVYQINGSTASFTAPTGTLKEYVIFGNQKFPKPRLAGKVANQNLHGTVLHDLTIVVPDIFRQEAERLAAFRREFDGLSVLLVSPQEIYNEFSSGVPDIAAIRNFMKMYYDRSAETGSYPRYLLLFGNGTYDNKNLLGYGGNLIPTFQTLQSLNPSNSYISDDFFGLLDNTEGFDVLGAIDLGIGRLPVRTVDEARFVVNKLIRYNQRVDGLQPGSDDPRFAGVIPNYSDWRNVISFIADDEDGNIHLNQTETLAQWVANNHPVYNIEKIYLDAYEQTTLAGGSRYPDVNKDINNRVNQGALLVNYVGHGGTLGLAHERILTFDDILTWGNFYNLPIFMTATCEFSSFDQPDPNELSAGVRIFLKPDGGAAALFTTTRLAYSHSNFTLNDAFINNAFKPMANGQMPRLGDLIRISKVQSSSVSTLKNFVLLGDPSMQLAYPKYKAVTTLITDTISALETITVKGEVHNQQGVKASDYNGVIYPIIYDKMVDFQTLANDGGSSPVSFELRNKIIYRGKASITNGEFEFSFMVPRDINYSTGKGKISYYFDDGQLNDGCGSYENFTISGTSASYVADDIGPEITLYLNNTNFRSGDETGPDPILLADLTDESGINTTGQIGHDIVAFLNNETSAPYVLNQYYQSGIDSYQSGRVVYPFFNMEKGEYSLTLRAWDVHNNVSTSVIDFIVTSAPGLELTRLMNFPNPFSEFTQFSIEHNKPATELQIIIEIFSVNGQLVKSFEQKVYASGYNVPPIEWDGKDQQGTLLNNGVYIFRAQVSTTEGDQVQKTEKLMILR